MIKSDKDCYDDEMDILFLDSLISQRNVEYYSFKYDKYQEKKY